MGEISKECLRTFFETNSFRLTFINLILIVMKTVLRTIKRVIKWYLNALASMPNGALLPTGMIPSKRR